MMHGSAGHARSVSCVVDFPPRDDVCGALEEHIRRFFSGHATEVFTWTAGPIRSANEHFRVLRVEPKHPDGAWTYVTTGGWANTAESSGGTEFILSTPVAVPRAVELLAMAVYYDRDGRLGLGHTLPIGEPWLPGSICDHFLISLPYPWGPQLQTCHVGDRHVEFLWLLPITSREREFKTKHGQEALEVRFEEVQLRYWNAQRDSAV